MSHRKTGRTTRLVEEAVRLAKEGKAVCVVAGDGHLLQQLVAATTDAGPDVTVEFKTPHAPDIKWDTLTLVGRDANQILLVDHHVIEMKFAVVLEMLHRFDLKKEDVVDERG